MTLKESMCHLLCCYCIACGLGHIYLHKKCKEERIIDSFASVVNVLIASALLSPSFGLVYLAKIVFNFFRLGSSMVGLSSRQSSVVGVRGQ